MNVVDLKKRSRAEVVTHYQTSSMQESLSLILSTVCLSSKHSREGKQKDKKFKVLNGYYIVSLRPAWAT